MSPSYAVADYWLAYLFREKDPAKSRQHLQRALDAAPNLVFPYRLETLPVLRWAGGQAEHWKTTYYLALVLWNIGRLDEAKSLFAELSNVPDWSPFYLARAKLLTAENDGEKILADIQRAVDLDKTNWRAWRALTDFYEKNGRLDLAMKTSKTVYDLYPEKSALAMDYAKALFYSGDFEGCLNVLERTTVLPYEGGWEGHDLFRRANLFGAAEALKRGSHKRAVLFADKAKMWPEHLGVGKPYAVDERLENYLLALAAEKAGNRKEAKKYLEAVAADTQKFRAGWSSEHFVSALAMKKLGREDEAVQLLNNWRKESGEADAVAGWAIAKLADDESAAAQALAGLKAGPGSARWDLGTGDRYFPLVLKIADLTR